MRIYTLLLLTCVIFSGASAQKKLASDTNKYRINLPEYWKPGNKVWRILNDNLPKVCNELANKDLCGDNCNPAYTVDFELTEPTILDYYSNKLAGSRHEIITVYTFQSNLYVRNKDGQITSKIILADTNEVFQVKHTANINEFIVPPTPTKFMLIKNQANQPEIVLLGSSDPASLHGRTRSPSGESPFSYINKNKEKLAPTTKDLYDIIDKKIKSLQE